MTLQQYAENLFPAISASQAQQIATEYQNVGSDIITQAITLYGECKNEVSFVH